MSFFAFLCFKELFCAQNAYCCYARGDCNCSCRFCDHVILCLKVMFNHWFTQGPKTFSYITAIVGFVLMIGASQFVFANWHVMIHEGDRDNCYYNDFCYRVSPWHDIPFNLMISNLTYILHGVILAISVCLMEARHLIDGEEFKGKFSFSIGYAFAWALIFEGCFSLIYHLCPSQMTFQFDTAFMFVIAGFTVVLLYNGIVKSVIPSDDAKGPMGATNFFLYFLVPLFIFNYFGALHHFEMHNSKEGMRKSFEIPLFVFVVMWWVLISIWAAYKLSATLCSGTQSCSDKFCHCGRITFAFCVAAPIFVFICTRNLSETFLHSCITESFVAIVVPNLVKAYIKKRGTFCKSLCQPLKTCRNECSLLLILKIVYFLMLVGFWVFAIQLFQFKPTTNKVKSPEISRDLNEECAYDDFFDYHDMWHILSSHALLLGAYLVMFISYESPDDNRELRGDFNSNSSQGYQRLP